MDLVFMILWKEIRYLKDNKRKNLKNLIEQIVELKFKPSSFSIYFDIPSRKIFIGAFLQHIFP